MRKLLFILALVILPALTFAQGAGGQIKRPVKKVQQSSLRRAQAKKTAQPAKDSPASVPTKTPPIVSQTIRQFFPVWGITLNETTIKQAKSMGYKIETNKDGSKHFVSHGADFRDDDKDGYFDHLGGISSILVSKGFELPEEWKSKGFSWDNSYDRWIQLFKDLGFSIKIERGPTVKEFEGRKTLSAMVIATSLDNTLYFVLGFDFGESYQTSSPRTIFSLYVGAN